MNLLKDFVTNSLYVLILLVQDTQTQKIRECAQNGVRPIPLASSALLWVQRGQHLFWRRYCSTWKQNLFLATKRHIKMNDSSQQALNCSLNPSPSGRRITVIMLPCVKQTFLQNYRYSKNTSEYFSCFSLQKNTLPPLRVRAQGSDRKPVPALEMLPAYAPLSHPSTSAPSTGTNAYQQESGQEKIIFTLKGKPNNVLLGKIAGLAVLLVHC